jgi:hypothetical protein
LPAWFQAPISDVENGQIGSFSSKGKYPAVEMPDHQIRVYTKKVMNEIHWPAQLVELREPARRSSLDCHLVNAI